MKTIGLIGGMSWQSSLEYYRILNETVTEKLGGHHSARCVMYSVDFQEVERLQHRNEWGKLSEIMEDAAKKLKEAGAEFIIICTNTMHKVAENIEKSAGIKVLHIAEATGKKIIDKKIKKVGLLGTRFTMEGDFYKNVLNEKFNIETIIPDAKQRETVHDIIYNELCLGVIKQESQMIYKQVIDHLITMGAEGIILGCTEIPLLIQQEDIQVPIFDTTLIHATTAVEYALK